MEAAIKEIIELLQLMCYKIGCDECGVNIHRIHEINKPVKLPHISITRGFVEEVIDLRGEIIPVINLQSRPQPTEASVDKDTRIVVVKTDNGTASGFIVDNINEVLKISSGFTELLPEIFNDSEFPFIKSIVKHDDKLLILLDIDKGHYKSERTKNNKNFNIN